jgi:pimeloyl-ACP methyl ester carboxylesterase
MMDFEHDVVPAVTFVLCLVIAWLSARRIWSLRGRTYPAWRMLTERVVISLLGIVALAAAVSTGWNALALYRFRQSPPGQIYEVNGHKMRLDCMGSGSPTIVLDAGLGNDGLIWGGVQPVLAKTTRVCSYDRAGFGWSDPLPDPRDANHIAAELYGLLGAARINGPIVLMGHSISGIYMRAYVARYPSHVAGVIFVDGSTPWQNRNPAFPAVNPPGWLHRLAMLRYQATVVLGLPRVRGECSRSFPGFDARASKLQSEDYCRGSFSAVAAEWRSMDQSGAETVGAGPFGDLPILIFSQDPAQTTAEGSPRAMVDTWFTMQENLKKLSTRSRRIIAKGSGHMVQLKRADLLEREVALFIAQVRGEAPEPTDYGTTVTE